MHEKTDIFTKLSGKHTVTIYEDDGHYYIIPSDTKKDKYDNSFYLYDKKRKTMKWVPSVISYFPQIDNAKLVKSVQRREVRHMNKLNYSGDPHSVLIHYSDYLMHFNPNHDPNNGRFTTKGSGMRLGVRRYQNPDGSLTVEGQRRYDAELRRDSQKKKENRAKDPADLRDPDKWVKEDIQNTKSVADASEKLIRDLQDANKPKRKEKKFNLSSMNDDDLRRYIQRMQMEEQYNRLKNNGNEISKGRAFIDDTLQYAGTLLTLASSSLALALAIKNLRTP